MRHQIYQFSESHKIGDILRLVMTQKLECCLWQHLEGYDHQRPSFTAFLQNINSIVDRIIFETWKKEDKFLFQQLQKIHIYIPTVGFYFSTTMRSQEGIFLDLFFPQKLYYHFRTTENVLNLIETPEEKIQAHLKNIDFIPRKAKYSKRDVDQFEEFVSTENEAQFLDQGTWPANPSDSDCD